MKNITIVLFGATGDLSKRKIIPALYCFVAHKKLENVIKENKFFDNDFCIVIWVFIRGWHAQ
jgi:hypothetical protein